jgi:hypothetical protein
MWATGLLIYVALVFVVVVVGIAVLVANREPRREP